MAALDYRHLESTSLYDQLIVIAAFQRIDEDRISRRFGGVLRNRQEEDVSVYSLTIDASKELGDKDYWSVDYGFDIQHNSINSSAFDQNIQNGAITDQVLTRYASDANRLTNFGAYTYVRKKNEDESLIFHGGLRFSGSDYFLRYNRSDPVEWPVNFYEGIQGNNQSFTWSFGTSYKFHEDILLKSVVSTAFRSPNVDDLSKIRINGGEITFPNIELTPERSTNYELSVQSAGNSRLSWNLTGYYTRLHDAIIRQPFFGPSGQSTWISQGEELQIVGNKNVQNGEIYGLSANAIWTMSERFTSVGNISFTRGREIAQNSERIPLAHIPPTYGDFSLEYHLTDFTIKSAFRFNSAKPLEEFGGSADNPELATADGALAWSTINTYVQYDLTESWNISLALENILDKHYRPFASGVSAPGRNLIFSIQGKF